MFAVLYDEDNPSRDGKIQCWYVILSNFTSKPWYKSDKEWEALVGGGPPNGILSDSNRKLIWWILSSEI